MIKEKYTNPHDDSEDMTNDGKDNLITQFAKALRKLKEVQWHNSIDELPEGKTLPGEHMLLLWKLDESFTDTFCTPVTPQQRTNVGTRSRSTSKSTTDPKSASTSGSPRANLSEKISS